MNNNHLEREIKSLDFEGSVKFKKLKKVKTSFCSKNRLKPLKSVKKNK